jgi:hypothetical protein
MQVLEVGSEDLMATAFAEASILESLRGWRGSVQMLACSRLRDSQVQLVLERCDCNLRQWASQQRTRNPAAWGTQAMR